MTTEAVPSGIPVPHSNDVESEENDIREHLMHDPRPRAELNRMVMESMQVTPKSFWVIVGILALLVAVCLFGAWLYMIMKGMGVAGIYPYEIASMKADKAMNLAKAREYPLLCTVEEE